MGAVCANRAFFADCVFRLAGEEGGQAFAKFGFSRQSGPMKMACVKANLVHDAMQDLGSCSGALHGAGAFACRLTLDLSCWLFTDVGELIDGWGVGVLADAVVQGSEVASDALWRPWPEVRAMFPDRSPDAAEGFAGEPHIVKSSRVGCFAVVARALPLRREHGATRRQGQAGQAPRRRLGRPDRRFVGP